MFVFQLFQSVNILADAVGPATMGLKGGSNFFFMSSATLALCIILLHTFWSIIFFDAIQKRNNANLSYVVLSHLMFSCVTLLNASEMYGVTLTLSVINVVITMAFAFKVAGGSLIKLKRFVTCQ
jgi:gamma-secretase subunit APH-1